MNDNVIEEYLTIIDQTRSILNSQVLSGITYINYVSSPNTTPSNKKDDLDTIIRDVEKCKKCAWGSKNPIRIVGMGKPDSRLVIVGTMPETGINKDCHPFGKEAGDLLNKMIKAINIEQSMVYICNILKCSTPLNKEPSVEEITGCKNFLKRQIDIIAPEFILAMGDYAADFFVNDTKKAHVNDLRDRIFQYKDARVIITHHPAFLISSPEYKKEAWEDLKTLKGIMER